MGGINTRLKELVLANNKLSYPKYGSRSWANHILIYCIGELDRVDRDLSARRIEVFHFLKELESYNYWWQVARLRNHINLAIKRGRFTLERSESDHPKVAGGGSH